AGDNVVVRAGRVSGSGSYYPWLRLHGSVGSVGKDEWNNDADTFLSYRATNGGPFTLLVGSYYTGHQGVYNLRYLKVPGEFIIPPGDEGGPLTNGVTHGGTNSLGDEDIWRFTANAGDNVVLRAERVSGSGSYYPWLRLHGPDGTVVNTAWNSSGDAVLEYPATVGGTYTLLVGSYYTGHSGVYRVSLTGGP
ncbi:MAG: PPC domain-containing protein, partial [Limisphaerales bacterium]